MHTPETLTQLLEGTTPGPWKRSTEGTQRIRTIYSPTLATIASGVKTHRDTNRIAAAPTLATEYKRLLEGIEELIHVYDERLSMRANSRNPYALGLADATGATINALRNLTRP